MKQEISPKWDIESVIDKDLLKDLCQAMKEKNNINDILFEYRQQITGNNNGSYWCSSWKSEQMVFDFLKNHREDRDSFNDYLDNLDSKKQWWEKFADEEYEHCEVWLRDWAVDQKYNEIMEIIIKEVGV